MNNFQFVTLTNPADVKEKRHQFLIRGHAIRTSAKKTRKEAVRKKENFVVVGIDPNDGGPVKRRAKEKKVAVSRAPSIGRLDPFNSLPANPERLRMLMRHSQKVACESNRHCADIKQRGQSKQENQYSALKTPERFTFKEWVRILRYEQQTETYANRNIISKIRYSKVH